MCVDCRRSFLFDPEFFESRGWRFPLRCHGCRAARRARRVSYSGTILSTGRAFALLRADCGLEFITTPAPHLGPGQRVKFTALQDEPAPGRRRTAHDIEPER